VADILLYSPEAVYEATADDLPRGPEESTQLGAVPTVAVG
jgi:hypothetical protein